MTDSRPVRSAARRPPVSASTSAELDGETAIDYGVLGESVGFLLKRAQMAVFADFIATFAAADIRPAQFSVLVIVGRNPGLKQSQVSAALSIKRTNFVPLLDSLEDRGLVKRKMAAMDRRSHALHLTPKGAALLKELSLLWEQHERRIQDKLGGDGRAQLLTLLTGLDGFGGASGLDEADLVELPPPTAKARGRRGAKPAAETT
jgi:DNA-binding MarR family transcriptional regulator